jgi:hypothetical protein
MTVYNVRIFTDYSDTVPRDVVAFTDGQKAADFADDIREDDGLAGISNIEIEIVPSDEVAVSQWWNRLLLEV